MDGEEFFFCDCEPEIDFTDSVSWREHMINVHDKSPWELDMVDREMERVRKDYPCCKDDD